MTSAFGFPSRHLTALDLVDLNQDGAPDIVGTSRASFNFGHGSFGRWLDVPGGAHITSADFDGDCHEDVGAVSSLGNLTFLYGSPLENDASPCGNHPRFQRGDPNGDGVVNVTDAIVVLRRAFLGGGALPCLDAADANDDGALNVADAIWILRFLFADGPPPPGEPCGVKDENDLGCEQYKSCDLEPR